MNVDSGHRLHGIRILLVEDHDDTRDMLQEFLTQAGARVLTAPTALEAVPLIVMCDVVVTDLAMPGRDGRWLVDQVKSGPHPVPVIALTAYSEDYDLAGTSFARVLTKPIDPADLSLAILGVLRRA